MNKLNIALMHTIQASRILVSQSTLEAFEGEQKGRSSGARGSRKGFPFSNPPPPTFPSRTRIQVCGFTVSVLCSSSLVSFAAVIRVVTQSSSLLVGGALCDSPNNSCEEDYFMVGYYKVYSIQNSVVLQDFWSSCSRFG